MSSDDEDLKLAMAMSLEEVGGPIDLSSSTDDDDDDEDLKRAIALSLQEGSNNDEVQSPNKSAVAHAPRETSLSSMGMDRKAMEQERLARLGKRKREPSPERPSKQVSAAAMASGPTLEPVLQYPTGAIKRTFAVKYPRTDDITIDEVLEASEVRIAVISSFMWDADWLFKKLNPANVKQIWIMNAKGKDVQQRWQREMENMRVPNLELHFPPMDGMIQSMHSKFMLLFSREKLRVVIPTANMTQIDWGEVANNWQPGVMENSVFLVDLPRRGNGAVCKKEDLTRFGQELVHFLDMQKVPQKVVEGILKFDFSQTSNLAFIHSIGGSHKTESTSPTGLPGLTKAIQDLRLDSVERVEIDYAASSLGAINDHLLSRIYLAACGQPFTTDTSVVPNVRDRIRIYFPTNETVEKSHGGPDCGGIISLTRRYYNAATFPRECLHNYESLRRGMLSHNKLIFVRGRKKDGNLFAWVYVGSANISESAWGAQKVVKNGSMGALNIRNWECGVVVPVPDDRLSTLKLGNDEVAPMSVFGGTVEVPFRHPGEKYEGKQPWFFRPG